MPQTVTLSIKDHERLLHSIADEVSRTLALRCCLTLEQQEAVYAQTIYSLDNEGQPLNELRFNV